MRNLDGRQLHSRIKGRQALERRIRALLIAVHRFARGRQLSAADRDWCIRTLDRLTHALAPPDQQRPDEDIKTMTTPEQLETGKQYHGECTTWIEGQGYGFIRPHGQTSDVFVHVTALENARALGRGDRVWFTLKTTADGRLSVAWCEVDGGQ